MIVLIIVLILVALVVGDALLIRRLRRRRRELATRTRSLVPEVLVTKVASRPDLNDIETLERRLSSSRSIFERVRALSGVGALSREQLDVVEEVLLRSDIGVTTTNEILAGLVVNGAPSGIASALRAALLSSLSADRSIRTLASPGRVPVWLFVGVNGVGKTTTIGKLAQRHVNEGRRVMLAAGDTFRAAAVEQLQIWGQRVNNSNSGRPGPGATSCAPLKGPIPDRSCTTPLGARSREDPTSCSPIRRGGEPTVRTCSTNFPRFDVSRTANPVK